MADGPLFSAYFFARVEDHWRAIERALGELNVPISKYHSERYAFV